MKLGKDHQVVGRHLLVGLTATKLTSKEAALMRGLRPSGIILFKRNFERVSTWMNTLERLLAEAKDAVESEDLLISVDHEGGRVHRFPDPVTHFPYAAYWRECAAEVAECMARELHSLGFNLSFAPLLDTNLDTTSRVIGDRAFSRIPAEVSAAAAAFRESLERNGLLSCGKHFPGHGGTSADSHFELPVLDKSKDELLDLDLIPFVDYLGHNPPLLMSAHVMFPKLDKELPASLSPSVLSDFLRNELGYQGAIITDDLEMKALAQWLPAQRAVLALLASTDLLLEGDSKDIAPLEQGKLMVEGLLDALDKQTLPESIFWSSQKRITQLIATSRKLQHTITKRNPREIVACTRHRELRARIATA